jgi:hypothetical protein
MPWSLVVLGLEAVGSKPDGRWLEGELEDVGSNPNCREAVGSNPDGHCLEGELEAAGSNPKCRFFLSLLLETHHCHGSQ